MDVHESDIRKANRKGCRDAELEDKTGFISRTKIFRNKKKYTRKNKHKNENK